MLKPLKCLAAAVLLAYSVDATVNQGEMHRELGRDVGQMVTYVTALNWRGLRRG